MPKTTTSKYVLPYFRWDIAVTFSSCPLRKLTMMTLKRCWILWRRRLCVPGVCGLAKNTTGTNGSFLIYPTCIGVHGKPWHRRSRNSYLDEPRSLQKLRSELRAGPNYNRSRRQNVRWSSRVRWSGWTLEWLEMKSPKYVVQLKGFFLFIQQIQTF